MAFMAKKKYNFDASNYCCQNKNCKWYGKENTGHVRLDFLYKGKQGTIPHLRYFQCKKGFQQEKVQCSIGDVTLKKRSLERLRVWQKALVLGLPQGYLR